MWENLKEKLPMKAEYKEDFESFEVTILDMEITKELVSFKLQSPAMEFTVDCNREYLGIKPDSRGLLIDAPHCWTMLIPSKKEA